MENPGTDLPIRTRARTAEHAAYTLLEKRGYQVFRCTGLQSPVDLIAWTLCGEPTLIRVKRTRAPVGTVAQVAARYRDDLTHLRSAQLPRMATVQFWLLAAQEGQWRIYTVYPGGIAEEGSSP
ncbi:MAG: hypothetical protein WC295_11305 [Methanoregula sp.]|jgi:hypothetical protein